MPAAAPRLRVARYVGRRRAAPQRTVLGTIGAVTALCIAGGAVAVTQALPQRAEASSSAGSMRSASSVEEPAGPQPMRPALPATARRAGAAGWAPPAREPRGVRVSRSTQRTAFAWCDGKAPVHSYRNGRIPLDELCRLPFARQHRLRADAAVALARLAAAYRVAFDDRLCLTDSYRSYASQVSVAARKPGLAARPGTSEHGWGLAVDLCDGAAVPGARQHTWLLAHAPAFGWDNPRWARPHGSRPEPWHWEYVDGE